MIPRADVLELARVQGLLATTVDKDYVLGWLLYGIAADPVLSRWVFKGGTCLKKCFFETYRFSEDLDFTVQEGDARRGDHPCGNAAGSSSQSRGSGWVRTSACPIWPGGARNGGSASPVELDLSLLWPDLPPDPDTD